MVMRNLIDFQIMGCEQRPVALALIAMRYPTEAIGSHLQMSNQRLWIRSKLK